MVVIGAAAVGIAVGTTFVLLPQFGANDLRLMVPWEQIALVGTMSAVAAAIVLAATMPVLARAVRPEALRSE